LSPSRAGATAAAASLVADGDDLSAPTIAPEELLRLLDATIEGSPLKLADGSGRTVTLQAKGMQMRTQGSSSWQKRTVLLFSDCVVWCKERKFGDRKLVYRGHVPLNVVLLDKHPGEPSTTTTTTPSTTMTPSQQQQQQQQPPQPPSDLTFQLVRMDQQASVVTFQPTSFTSWFEWTTNLAEAIDRFRATDATLHKQALEAANNPHSHASMMRAARIARRLIESERDFADDIDVLLHSYWIPMVTSSVIEPSVVPEIFGPIERVAIVHVAILEHVDRLRQEAAATIPAVDEPPRPNESDEEAELRQERLLDDRLPASHWLRAVAGVVDVLLRERVGADESAPAESPLDLYRMFVSTAERRAANLNSLTATKPTLATFIRAQESVQDANSKLRLLLRRPCERVLLYAAVCEDLRTCMPIGSDVRAGLDRLAPLLDDIARPFRRSVRALSAAFAAKQVVAVMLELENERDLPSIVSPVVPGARAISSESSSAAAAAASSSRHRKSSHPEHVRRKSSRRSVMERVSSALKIKPAAPPTSANIAISAPICAAPTSTPISAPIAISSSSSSTTPSAAAAAGGAPSSPRGGALAVFGKRLSELQAPSDDDSKSPRHRNFLPGIVRAAISEIDRHLVDNKPSAHSLQGLFREAVSHTKLNNMRARIDAGEQVDLRDEDSPHFAANLLKLWLRELPTPLLPDAVQERILRQCGGDVGDADGGAAEAIRVALSKMNAGRRAACLEIVGLLTRCVQHQERTRMTALNVAVIFSPVLFPPAARANMLEAQTHIARANRAVVHLIEQFPVYSKARPPTSRPPPAPVAAALPASPQKSRVATSVATTAAAAQAARKTSSEDISDGHGGGGGGGGDDDDNDDDDASDYATFDATSAVSSLIKDAEQKNSVAALHERIASLEARMQAADAARIAAEKDRDQLRALLIMIEHRLSTLEERGDDDDGF
jgi:hypothetical protein